MLEVSSHLEEEDTMKQPGEEANIKTMAMVSILMEAIIIIIIIYGTSKYGTEHCITNL